MVRTSASSTEGESPQPARSERATTFSGRIREPCSLDRILCASLASSAVGCMKSGNGDVLENCACAFNLRSRRASGDAFFGVDLFDLLLLAGVSGGGDADDAEEDGLGSCAGFSSSSILGFLVLRLSGVAVGARFRPFAVAFRGVVSSCLIFGSCSSFVARGGLEVRVGSFLAAVAARVVRTMAVRSMQREGLEGYDEKRNLPFNATMRTCLFKSSIVRNGKE